MHGGPSQPQIQFGFLRVLILFLCVVTGSSCASEEVDPPDAVEDDLANAVGEVMSSVDESLLTQFSADSIPSARACFSSLDPFGDCEVSALGGALRTRDYASCTVNQGSFDGTVTLSFSASDCTLDSTGKSVSRIPSMTIEGRNGDRTLTVFVVSGSSGATLTRGTSTESYSLGVDGLVRTATRSGDLVLNQQIDTGSSLPVVGISRQGRTMNLGSLTVADSLTGDRTELEPSQLVWDSSCTCPISGSWSGETSHSTGATTYVIIEMTGCAQALVTRVSSGAFTETEVEMDRCDSL